MVDCGIVEDFEILCVVVCGGFGLVEVVGEVDVVEWLLGDVVECCGSGYVGGF